MRLDEEELVEILKDEILPLLQSVGIVGHYRFTGLGFDVTLSKGFLIELVGSVGKYLPDDVHKLKDLIDYDDVSMFATYAAGIALHTIRSIQATDSETRRKLVESDVKAVATGDEEHSKHLLALYAFFALLAMRDPRLQVLGRALRLLARVKYEILGGEPVGGGVD